MSLDYEIRQFDRQRLPVAADLAGLHGTLLAHSPIPLLGPRFAEGFYYGYLPAAGFLFGAVAYVDNHPAGFAAATVTPGGFLAPALKRPFWVAWLIGRSVLADPKRISAVWEAWLRIRQRSKVESRSGVAEILSMGVLADVGATVFRKKRARISVDLLTSVVSMCRERAAREVRVTVETTNLGTQLLYTTFGWHREEGNLLGSQEVVEYSLNLESPSTHGT
jgi:hypothetical protein